MPFGGNVFTRPFRTLSGNSRRSDNRGKPAVRPHSPAALQIMPSPLTPTSPSTPRTPTASPGIARSFPRGFRQGFLPRWRRSVCGRCRSRRLLPIGGGGRRLRGGRSGSGASNQGIAEAHASNPTEVQIHRVNFGIQNGGRRRRFARRWSGFRRFPRIPAARVRHSRLPTACHAGGLVSGPATNEARTVSKVERDFRAPAAD